MRVVPRVPALLALFVVLAIPLIHAQGVSPAQAPILTPVSRLAPPIDAATGPTFRAATELVALNVTVTDPEDRFVKGLRQEDFAVFEDGVPQNVTFFAATDVPLDLAIMIDTSASMTDKMAFVHEAATKFVETLHDGDRAEVIGFSDQAHVLEPFTGDKGRLGTAIASSSPKGSTALYTSIYVAIQDLQRLAKREEGVRRTAIVVLTDGDDTSSLLSFDDLLDCAERTDVAVYTIAIVSPFSNANRFDGDKRFSTEADFALRKLSQETGGRSFFPLELKDLNGVYQRIADELTSQYSIGYPPRVKADGSFHRLCVRVLHHENARPRTRTGYYSSRPIRAALGDEAIR